MLPFFRAERFIAEAIESVLAQRDFEDWRLYLVNDGSDEGDVAVARRFCRLYPQKMELLEHGDGQRCGASASRNLGIHRSTGSLVAFLDADDTWYPHKLLSQVALLDAHPGADMTYGPALRWYSWAGGEDVDVPVLVDGYDTDSLVPGTAVLETFLHNEWMTPCTGSVLVRRSALLRVGCFESQFWGLYDDQVLYAKLCLNGNIFVSNDCVSRYRQHPESCCAQAATEGGYEVEQQRFLNWLTVYREKFRR